MLNQLDRRVLYYDTDSVVFVDRPGDPPLPTGPYLGDLTNELEDHGEGAHIVEFCSGGPKHYGYVVRNNKGEEKTIMKVKGLCLNYQNSEVVNFETMKKLVKDFVEGEGAEQRTVNMRQIQRRKDFSIVTAATQKTYRVVYEKRVVLPDYTTRPFGWSND